MKPDNDTSNNPKVKPVSFVTLDDDTKNRLRDYVKTLNEENTKIGIEFDKNVLTVLGILNAGALLAFKDKFGITRIGDICFFVSFVMLIGALCLCFSTQLLAVRMREYDIKRTEQCIKSELSKEEYENADGDMVRSQLHRAITFRNKLVAGLPIVAMASILIGLVTAGQNEVKTVPSQVIITDQRSIDMSKNKPTIKESPPSPRPPVSKPKPSK